MTLSLSLLFLALLSLLATGVAIWMFSSLQETLQWMTRPPAALPLQMQDADIAAATEELLSR